MIETRQSLAVAAPLSVSWDYVSDIGGWAQLMPGMQSCDIIDSNHSLWVLKVGLGGMVRTVRVKVTVESWAGPEEVDFCYALDGDPVTGTGTYRAAADGPCGTVITLWLTVSGSGPLAPMWEAMGRPLLPRLAATFIGQLRDAIEAQAAVANAAPAASFASTFWQRLFVWLRRLWD